MSEGKIFKIKVLPDDEGKRLDSFLAEKIPEITRSQAKKLIESRHVKVNENIVEKPKYKIKADEKIEVIVPAPKPLEIKPEKEVPFEILYEDKHLAVINKPPGVVVHPGAGHYEGTLVHGLLARLKDLSGIGGELRPGIVHRLDKDTSGLLVVAKDDPTHQALTQMFKDRQVKKVYLALVHGVPRLAAGKIEKPIGRHPVNRQKMSVHAKSGREAITFYRIREKFSKAALLEVEPKTGRTHQIRVHLAFIGYPIVGDELYGGARPHGPKARRQMLHAFRLEFKHPVTGEDLAFEAPLPEDFEELLNELRQKS
ncbi:RluA family pseudouridine synthase [Thermodesulfatator autotrophicus]|uniref:Pseudouridine synthase n=1 Tax=Thermodesulfatator autotrophicus TaxID=1795632 RepID=A0A177EAT5_9BACT|nr:RluA family pseudouridine synthase [Thermodesulfatator autotrophicus]OAG28631.1 RNA pseudouridine synthase [Thermodesulfatator autotrophicus]